MTQQEDALKALDQEAKKRREEVNVKATRPLPEFVRTIESTTVIYTVDPDILPFALIEPAQLVALANKRFNLKFRHPQYDARLLENLGFDSTKMTEEGLLKFLLEVPRPEIRFQSGRYPTGPDTFVFIEELVFARETIAARVKGITEVAQLVIAEAFAIFWEAAGPAKRWDDRDTQQNVQLVSFQSVTNIDLGVTAEHLINPRLREFLDEGISKPGGIGTSMLAFSAYDRFQPNPNAVASWSFDQLVLNVHVFDTSCGRTNTAKIDLDTTSKGDRGRGVVELTTELPFDSHIELAEQIRSLLS